jgi:hypothetical protein
MIGSIQNHKIEEPDVYLGPKLGKIYFDRTQCWTMSAEPYVLTSVNNVQESLAKKGHLPSKCFTPLAVDYHPELESLPELKSDEIQTYQEYVGVLRWAVKLGRVDILLET